MDSVSAAAAGTGSAWTSEQCQLARQLLSQQEGRLTQRVWKTFRTGVLEHRTHNSIRSHMQKRYCSECHQAYENYVARAAEPAPKKRARQENEKPPETHQPQPPEFKRVTLQVPASTKIYWLSTYLLTADPEASQLESSCRAAALNYVEAVCIDGRSAEEAWSEVPEQIQRHVSSSECQERGGLAIARLYVEYNGIDQFFQAMTAKLREQSGA